MKKRTLLTALSAMGLVLGLAGTASADPSDTVKGIFDALVADDSGYTAEKATYGEYFPDIVYEETLEEEGFNITVTGSEFMDGSWTFTQDGDYLVTTNPGEDYTAISTSLDVLEAVATYYGMNREIISSYITGLNVLGLDNPYFIMTDNEEEGTTTIQIFDANAFELQGLDEMALDERSLEYEPLGEDYGSYATSIGKMMMVANGNVDDFTILLGENGGLDEHGFQSLINVVKTFQPKGWEAFAENYTELTDAEGDGYSVVVDPDMDAVYEIIDDPRGGDVYMVVRFGA